MSDAFDSPSWFYDGKKVDVGISAIDKRLRSMLNPKDPGNGVTWTLTNGSELTPILILLSTGSDAWTPDFLDVNFTQCDFIPDLSYFKRSIDICAPFEAFIMDNANERDLRSYERQRQFPNFERPAIIRWFHFFGESLVESLGGVEHCLETPGFKSERFCGGILLQLNDGPLDAGNPQHKEHQLKAMHHFELNSDP
jgi:hypothetical protein